jgi:hypothetical protein
VINAKLERPLDSHAPQTEQLYLYDNDDWGRRTRTKAIINGKSKTVQASIMKPMRDTQQRRPMKKSLMLKSKIKRKAITSTKMIKIITCDIRIKYVPWMHTYPRLK